MKPSSQESVRCDGHDPSVGRRWFLQQCGVGLGAMALRQLLAGSRTALAASSQSRAATRLPHTAPRAKRVIFLFMAGAPSQLELFDHKPQLARLDGTRPPASLIEGYRAAFIQPDAQLLGPRFSFARHGSNGVEMSELLPHLAGVSDEIAVVRSMVTDAFNHAPGQILMSTGTQQFGKPSMGAWITYGLGSEAEDFPSFIVFSTGKKGPSAGSSNWGCGFLPTVHQGVEFRSVGDPVLYLSNPPGVDVALQRDSIDSITRLNRIHAGATGDPEIHTRIHAYEMAFRMQAAAPDLMDLSSESRQTLEMYGAEPGKPSFANTCLLARRLVERGVRFVEIFHEAWDQHGNLVNDLKQNCRDTDRPAAALVRDLKQRGMLDETLVVWGGEFGRTPMVQGGSRDGRDHHPNAFTMWLAGGGIQPGMTLGQTDDLGFHVVQDRVHVHDLHATMLHLLGLDHTRLTYRFQGLDQRLTGVEPSRVVRELLA